jgi:F0F1-type ATP synthase epsilon subunit
MGGDALVNPGMREAKMKKSDDALKDKTKAEIEAREASSSKEKDTYAEKMKKKLAQRKAVRRPRK